MCMQGKQASRRRRRRRFSLLRRVEAQRGRSHTPIACISADERKSRLRSGAVMMVGDESQLAGTCTHLRGSRLPSAAARGPPRPRCELSSVFAGVGGMTTIFFFFCPHQGWLWKGTLINQEVVMLKNNDEKKSHQRNCSCLAYKLHRASRARERERGAAC